MHVRNSPLLSPSDLGSVGNGRRHIDASLQICSHAFFCAYNSRGQSLLWTALGHYVNTFCITHFLPLRVQSLASKVRSILVVEDAAVLLVVARFSRICIYRSLTPMHSIGLGSHPGPAPLVLQAVGLKMRRMGMIAVFFVVRLIAVEDGTDFASSSCSHCQCVSAFGVQSGTPLGRCAASCSTSKERTQR